MKYSTKKDRLRQIVAAIVPGTESPSGRLIYIDLITITDSSEENHANYQIKHGNFFPERSEIDGGVKMVEKATWDQFYIDGKEDGFPDGFQALDDVELFLLEEIERLEEKKIRSIISNEYSSDGVKGEQWNRVLTAWKGFQDRFLKAKSEGRLIDVETAKNMRKPLIN